MIPDAVFQSAAWQSASAEVRRVVVALDEELSAFRNGELGLSRKDLAALAGVHGRRPLGHALRCAERLGLIRAVGEGWRLTFALARTVRAHRTSGALSRRRDEREGA